MQRIAVVVGTRPEAIKLAPVIQKLEGQSGLQPLVCNTGQHDQLCGETLAWFGLNADVKLDVMRPNQGLAALQSRLLTGLDTFLAASSPDGLLVQGDTMSAFCGALAAFYRRLPVFHVEAGLRSYHLGEPFPEEALRQMLARIAALHFAPTTAAQQALLAEHIPPDNIHVTGNTVIDALNCLTDTALAEARQRLEARVDLTLPLVLVTVHRRENHGPRLEQILRAVDTLSRLYPACRFILPVHPNPNVKQAVHAALSGRDTIILTEPLSYPELVCVMQNAVLALSDSGGIQEEAPSFGLPVLVLRYETERREGLELGLARLVGADYEMIVREACSILQSPSKISTHFFNPYGDGKAAERIVTLIEYYTRYGATEQ
ncbi:UDP-N-acetylglucosamine 2-epimerase (non-hydrolyzing) [Desulfovibrio sp. ZJ200]|uniref:non-hydrolyzing UDP-N-acetylglucosamine 2-epimerase n=1 Tax=Desulfovibrio sp. ZJ200 TaxID=2709792 RepID=UPI0013EE3ECD|nr:UDP-N-acetylglucosamine 2-epimerase (non-hydrolyzing) [Desulfovibrio sp. ZJ200]